MDKHIEDTLKYLNADTRDAFYSVNEARKSKGDMKDGEYEADMNIRNQLNKARDSNRPYEISFEKGRGLKVSKQDAETVVKALDMLRPRERGMVQDEITKSSKEFEEFLEVAKELTESAYPEEYAETLEENYGAMGKREFKRAELEQELKGEIQQRSGRKPKKKLFRFYDVNPDQEKAAKAAGLRQTKSGKWAHVVSVQNYNGNPDDVVKMLEKGYKDRYRNLDRQFGKGASWSPEKALANALKNFK